MIYKKCIMTIAKNGATLDEDIYLYRLDKNIELHFTIVNNKYKFDKSDLNNIIAQTEAAYFQVRLYKNADIKYTFAIQPTDAGKAILKITDDLIDDPIEVGEYDFQISLLDADKTSMISMPIVSKQLHVCEPLVSENAVMGRAVLGLSKAAKGEIKNAFDSQGNYIREIHNDGEIISAQMFNKFEEALETNTKAIKNGTGGTGTSYDDTAIKADIQTLKDSQINLVEDETSMEGIKDNEYPTLTTTDKTLIGSINEVNAQYKDIVNKDDYINIESFRKINSANSNDTEMFTEAFTYCKNNKKNLLIDTKEYIINADTIVYDGSFSIKGINREQSILKCANEGEIFINTDKTTEIRKGFIDNITIDGDFKINNVVVFNGKKNIIRNSLIKNGKENALKLGDEFNCWENEISKCVLMGCENTSTLSPDNVVTFTKHATDNYMSDTIIQNSTEICLIDNGSNNRFCNIHIYGYPNEKRPKMCIKLNGSNSWLFNTQLDTPTECGILVTGYNNIITSNTCFWNTDFPSTGTEHFVTLDNLNTKRCSNNIITSNIVTYSGTKLSNVINILGDDTNNIIESNNGNISNDNGNKLFVHPNNYVVVNRKNKWYNPLGVDRYELNMNKTITLQNSWTPFEDNESVIAFKNELGQYVLSGRIANGLEDANTVIFNLAQISKNALPKRYLSYPITYRTKADEYKVAELGISTNGDVTIHGVSNCKYIMLNNITILNN